MWHFIKTYALVLPVFLLIDLTWLGKIMVKFYKSELGALARLEGDSLAPVVWAAAVVYLLIPLGIVFFALPRVDGQNMVLSALFWGFLYGVTLYGVYDMTNYSLLDKYPLRHCYSGGCRAGSPARMKCRFHAGFMTGWGGECAFF